MRERPSLSANVVACTLSCIFIAIQVACFIRLKRFPAGSPGYPEHAEATFHLQLVGLAIILVDLLFILTVSAMYKRRQLKAERRRPSLRMRHLLLSLPMLFILLVGGGGIYELLCVAVTSPAYGHHARVGQLLMKVGLPIGVVAQVATALAYRLSGDERRRRIDQGLCPICGYDLRESTGRCPECGTALLINNI